MLFLFSRSMMLNSVAPLSKLWSTPCQLCWISSLRGRFVTSGSPDTIWEPWSGLWSLPHQDPLTLSSATADSHCSTKVEKWPQIYIIPRKGFDVHGFHARRQSILCLATGKQKMHETASAHWLSLVFTQIQSGGSSCSKSASQSDREAGFIFLFYSNKIMCQWPNFGIFPFFSPHFSDLLDCLDFFKYHGIGVINASPLGMGLLTTNSCPKWHPASQATKKACSEAAKYCEEKGFNLRKY